VVNALQGGVLSFVAPGKDPLIEVCLLERCSVQEVAKLPHQAVINPIIVLVLGTVNHVEVSAKQQWAFADKPEIMYLRNEQ
jgi:hypothetical protein